MKQTSLLIAFLIFAFLGNAQKFTFQCKVFNDSSGEPIANVSIMAGRLEGGTVTKTDGTATVSFIPAGTIVFTFSSIGFTTEQLKLSFPLAAPDSVYTIRLKPEDKNLDEVIISSSRTDSRIENTPTRVEVLGAEEVDEESGVKPSHIASLLGDVAGIQTQQTSAVTAGTSMRIQGLPGDYTQILRDGMPLFGGFAGSFSVLQIPPLDLKQIEIIKGASSTLYGGGAIAGMINIISKKPKLGKKERTLLINQSTLNETNIHVFLTDRDKKKGYTFFGGLSYQKQTDVDKDGFSDLPSIEGFFIHPTLFFYPNARNTISVGINSIIEDRRGGDMRVLAHQPDSEHQFYIENQSYRNTMDLNWENKYSERTKFNFKSSVSSYIRNISTNVFGMKARQFSFFNELSIVHKSPKHDLVGGFNVNGDVFKKRQPDSAQFDNYKYYTLGLFIQDDWRIHPKFTIETGMRVDFHNEYGNFYLPRLSLLYKISPTLTTRFGGGLGYKVPSVFEADVDERNYGYLLLADDVVSEKSSGLNWDINWKKKIGNTVLALNQSFYITDISHPLVKANYPVYTYLYSALQHITTKGFETWAQVTWKGLEMYLGYTRTDAKRKYYPLSPNLELSARDKFASVISYEFSSRFRACIEAAYTGKQYVEDGTTRPGFPFIAAMVRYDIGRFSFVLNGENLFDYRQNKREQIVMPPFTNPTIKQLWAPIDGRVLNLSLKLSL